MTERPTAERLTDDDADPLPWEEVRDRIAATPMGWLATVHPDGRPHVRPVLFVVVGGRVHVTSGPTTRKARNLATDPRCTLSLGAEGLDVVVEGHAVRVTDPGALAEVSRVYEGDHGWSTTVVGDALDAADAAPTAGDPPYEPWAIVPTTVFAFGIDEDHAPRSTRFRF